MPPFKKRVNKPPEVEIKERFLELYETVDELKDLFKSILPENSLLKTILKIDTYQDRNEVCEILLSYLGNNFFATLGKIRADVQIKDKWDEFPLMQRIEMLEEMPDIASLDIDPDELEILLSKSFSRLPKQVRKKIETWNEKSLEPKYILREKLLQKICQHDMPDEPDKKEKKIVAEFNKMNHQKVESISQMVRHPAIISKKEWRRDLCHKILRLPETVAQTPDKEPPLPETISLQKRSKLLRLREYQTQGLLKVQGLLSNDEDPEERQKRILVNLPTGAGKTRLAVESIIEWLNLREQGKIQNANPQQKEARIIFWFASTGELCTQASTEFSHIYDQIGAVELLNLTNYYGADRRALDLILNDKPGTHIVITNWNHFLKQLKLEKKKEEGKKLKRFDAFKNSQYFKFIRKNTIAIIIDEAHEVTGDTYQDFLAAMGFNFSGTIESRKNINTNNIVLIGLTATAYKGSGLEEQKTSVEDDPDLSDFVEFDKENDLDYFKKLNRPTKLIHKIFGGVYIPNPQENTEKSRPIPVIDIPITAHVGDSIKISGINSFDNNVQIKSYSWKIVSFHAEEFKTEQAEFYHKFSDPGTHTIILKVTNQNDISETDSSVIKILPQNKKSKISGTGSLEDNVEFYKILEKSQVLCKVIHGVIEGPHLDMKDSEINNWKLNKLSAKDDEAITTRIEYNQKICDIVSKCITKYGKKRVLLFAHTVKHSQELMLILKAKYKLTAESVDGGTNPGIRRKIVKDFIKGDIQVLCNFGVFTTGFDVPKIDTLLICREVGRNALYTQMIGRGQRGENAGGTPDLWLITSQFPKPNCQQEKLKLGWEALAGTWEQFPDEIKDDLGLGTWQYEEKYVSKPKEKESIKDTHQIKIEPIEELELECQTCHIRKKGLKDNLEFYGYDQAYTPSLVKDILKQKTFPRHCQYCRPIRNIGKKSQDEFVKYVADNHEFNPHFLFVTFFANMIKSERQWQRRQVKLSDLENYLEKKWRYEIPKDDFNMDHPIIRKLERDKILEIDNYLNLKFEKIIDPTSMEKILLKLANHPALKNKTREILNEYQSRPTSKRSKLEDGILESYYEELKKELGHTPTRRQFESKLDKNQKTEFAKKYQRDYKKFLGFKRVIIKDDLDLKDALYDEYFEKCMRERSVITRDQLDAYGDYRIEDYEDVWGSFNKFTGKKLRDVLTDFLENMDELLNERDKEFEEITKDLIELRRKRGTNFIHFDEIWQHGGIRIFRYIIQLKISHLKYLKKYDCQYPGEFLRLISDYFRLKKTFGRAPTRTEFIKRTSPNTTAAYLKLFKGDYDKFLKKIGDTPPDSTTLGNHA